jgi:membrane-associated PAP2 superfamily phosphatase
MSKRRPMTPTRAGVRPLLLATILMLLVQASFGMAVNLEVAVPARHSGARPSNYLTGSVKSLGWAIGHGAAALAVHAALGLALIVVAFAAGVVAFRHASRSVAILTALGGLLVLGAGFNGASFLDFGHDTSSLIMALLCFSAIAAYVVALARLPAQRPSHPIEVPALQAEPR